MASFLVTNSGPLKGKVTINGAKNSVLPIMAASLLSDGIITLEDVPLLEDVNVMCRLLEHFGICLKWDNKTLYIDNSQIKPKPAPYELVRKMRASFLIMGPILTRFGNVKISLPGGCAIGTRPIDLHLKGLAAIGADITLGHGYIEARAQRLVGSRIYLDFPSVGATENIIMAAALADGLTIIENAAEEPEIIDLANFINAMGGRVRGAGTDTIKIEGVGRLSGCTHTIIPDRIEAGTFMVAAAITGGDIILTNVISDHLRPVEAKLKEAGIQIESVEEGIRVYKNGPLNTLDLKTLPYPGFPTDMQAQMMALMCTLPGTSMITETVFENRYMHVSELKRLGAKIKIEGRSAIIEGVDRLQGAQVKSTDLRAGAALLLAGMFADGTTEVSDIHHIDRGYERIDEKLRSLGANIKRLN
ncbi:MAG TPA: UDP-N-acetylglucosamine 1-carboxyvinyltransferase [Clostridiales bacterium]|nr:UDP-N-acetylglucosamine 1-carboxyvinyltransferase [Clostridiales bacterium]